MSVHLIKKGDCANSWEYSAELSFAIYFVRFTLQKLGFQTTLPALQYLTLAFLCAQIVPVLCWITSKDNKISKNKFYCSKNKGLFWAMKGKEEELE